MQPYQQPAPVKTWLGGAARSLTVWLGAAVATVPDWGPLIAQQLTTYPLFPEPVTAAIVRALGVAVILARFRTRASLPAKEAIRKEQKADWSRSGTDDT